MSNIDNFGKIFNSEKVKTWDKDYLNYNELIMDIKDIIEFQKKIIKENSNSKIMHLKTSLIEDNKTMVDLNERKSVDNGLEKIQKMGGQGTPLTSIINKNIFLEKKEEKIELYDNKEEIEKESYNNEEDKEKVQIKEKIDSFIKSLDKEIKKIYIFYSSKEKDIYQKINKKIQNKSKIYDKNPSDLIKEMNSLLYISELCKQIIIYIFWNIKALKTILFIFDKSTKNIVDSLAYLYLKKYLAQNNSDIIYILNFKTLDETIFQVEEISNEIKNIINKNNDFRNNKEQKENFKNFIDGIKINIHDYDKMYQNIFSELSEWKRFLNINLELPTSNYNSIFRNTTLVGDYNPSNFQKIKNSKSILKKNNYNLLNDGEGEDDAVGDNFSLYKFKNKEKKILNKYKIDLSKSLFNDVLSLNTKKKKILSNENNKNLILIYIFLFFYSFSYCIIIPLLNEQKLIKSEDEYEEYCHFFGLIITMPILGNLVSLIYINKLIKYKYKLTLFLSLFLILIYYLILIAGRIVYHLKEKINNYTFFLLLGGRFFLGLSNLRLIGKEYINIFIPNESQIKANQNYLKSSYIGFIIGFLLIGIQNLSKEFEPFKNTLTGLIAASCVFSILLCLLALINFEDPKNKNFRSLRNSYIIRKRKNMIANNINLSLEQDEKKIVEQQENYFENANKIALLEGVNYLTNESSNLEKNQKKYFNKIFRFLIILLLTSEYTSENFLIFLPIINIQKENDNDYKYGLFSYSFSYLLNLLFEAIFLKIISQKHLNKSILKILSIISIIILLVLFIHLLDIFSLKNLFFLNSLMITISDFFKILTVNLFIALLPDGNFSFMCMRSNNFIVLIIKLSRLIPGIITFFNKYVENNYNKLKFYDINLGLNILLYISSFIYLFYFRKLKSNSLIRIVASPN